jgi:hypothetical protein
MGDDFQKLVEKVERAEKERADKVARFLEMLRDPDLAGCVAVLRNGNHQPEPAKIASFIPPAGFKNGNGIREAVRSLALPARFTADDVHAALEAQQFEFASGDHRAAARDALYSLTKGDAPTFRKVRSGAGGLPNVYERVET